jgi:bisphosphoglycerate-independent phosphoglycerate mutase (AlkP superfamily)
MAAMMPVMASATAATATVAAAVAAIAAAVMAESHRLAVTADEGNANNGKEHSQTEQNDTIHPQILQLLTGTGK